MKPFHLFLFLTFACFSSCGNNSPQQEQNNAQDSTSQPYAQEVSNQPSTPNSNDNAAYIPGDSIDINDPSAFYNDNDSYDDSSRHTFWATITSNGHTVNFTNEEDYNAYKELSDYWRKCYRIQMSIEALSSNYREVASEMDDIYSDMQEDYNVSNSDLYWAIGKLIRAIEDIDHITEIYYSLSEAEDYAKKARWEANDISNAEDVDDLNDCSSYIKKSASACDDAISALDSTMKRLEYEMSQIEYRQ